MDARNPEYPQYQQRRSPRHHSATPSSSLSRSSESALPTRPEPTASPSQRDAHGRRRKEGVRGPRSTPHNSAKCENDLCDSPNIAADEGLYAGPRGLDLCRRCFKRFKVERRRAREAQRAMTDDWKRPKQRGSKVQTRSSESPRKTLHPTDRASPERLQKYSLPCADESSAKRNDNTYDGQATDYEKRGREPKKQPSTSTAQPQQDEKNPSLYNFAACSLKEYRRQTSRTPRQQLSRYERDDRTHMHNSHARNTSPYEEAEFYKYRRWEEDDDYYDERACCGAWSRRRRCVIILAAIISIIVLIIIITLAATLSRKDKFKYTPSFAQVNSTEAFNSGGGTRRSVNDTDDGIGAGTDTYTYYQGNASNFPPKERWISFKDMWDKNLDTFKYSCGWLKRGDNNTPEMIQDIYDAIQDRANASLVDHRIILATIIQETNGCPLSPPTTSSGGTRNPGLMQSHNGHVYDAKHSRLSIHLMVQDGTQGTKHGWGLVDNLNTYGNPYTAMRGYNSGFIPQSSDLSESAGATACYVTDIANRLTGWVRADSKCPGDAT